MGIEAEIDNSRSEIAENFKDDIICSICCSIFEDPVILDCCGGHLCSKCFQDVRRRFPNCPLCRKANFSAKQSRLMATVLSKVKLLCPADECRMSVPFEKFEEHKKNCLAWNKKTCPECKKVMSMNKFHEHFVCFEKRMKMKDSTELERKVAAQKKELNKLLTKNNVNSTKIKKMDELINSHMTKIDGLNTKIERQRIANNGLQKSMEKWKVSYREEQEKLKKQLLMNADLESKLKKTTSDKHAALETQRRRIVILEQAESLRREQIRKLTEENALLRNENSKLSAQTKKKSFMSSIFKKCK